MTGLSIEGGRAAPAFACGAMVAAIR